MNDKNRWRTKCSICGAYKGMIKKYRLYVCRRCFRQNAESIGFKKLS